MNGHPMPSGRDRTRLTGRLARRFFRTCEMSERDLRTGYASNETKQELRFFSVITEEATILSTNFVANPRFLLDNPCFPMISHLVPIGSARSFDRCPERQRLGGTSCGAAGKRCRRYFYPRLSIR